MPVIHPTALVDPAAEIDAAAEIGPYVIIEAGVRVGAGCRIEAHAQLLSGTDMGADNTVGRGAVIGGDPQSTAFNRSTRSGVRIGNANIFREHVTVHRSLLEGGETVIGDSNFLMVGAHVGHDTSIGNGSVLANAVLIGGHVTIGSRCFLGGGAGFHQFVRVGDYVMVQGNSAISKDVPPFAMAASQNWISGLNVVGMRRAGLDGAVRLAVKRVFTGVLRGKATAQTMLDQGGWPEEARNFLEFMLVPSPKGVCRWHRCRHED